MSSDSFIAYFGVRFEVNPDEIEGLEERSDARIVAARKSGLRYYWGNFGAPQVRYLLYIGRQIAVLGSENDEEVTLTRDEAESAFDETIKKLAAAGFSEGPALHLVWQPDV